MELDRQIAQQKSVFLQELNALKSAIDEWKYRPIRALILPDANTNTESLPLDIPLHSPILLICYPDFSIGAI